MKQDECSMCSGIGTVLIDASGEPGSTAQLHTCPGCGPSIPEPLELLINERGPEVIDGER